MQADYFPALLMTSNDGSLNAVLYDLLSRLQKRERGLHELTSSIYLQFEHLFAIGVFPFSSTQSQSTDSLIKMATAPKTQYESVANGYASYDQLPLAKLEAELVERAIGNCTGSTVLDLGGGEGQYARKAIELGAELVDVLDISPAMLALGIEAEKKIGREGKI
jgi:SAM-dependent methyltransferase